MHEYYGPTDVVGKKEKYIQKNNIYILDIYAQIKSSGGKGRKNEIDFILYKYLRYDINMIYDKTWFSYFVPFKTILPFSNS